MNGIANATDEQMGALDALVSSLASVEQTLNGLLAARDGLLALASRMALSIAEDGDGVDASDLTLRAVAAEIAAVQRVSDRTMQRRMSDAEWRVSRFPEVWAAQGAGRISAAHTRVIADAGAHLEDQADRDEFSRRVLEFAEQESPNRLGAVAARIAEQYQPRSLEERHTEARAKRRAWVTDLPDGMAELGVLGPAVLVHGAHERLTQMAAALSAKGTATEDRPVATVTDAVDDRGVDERRADLALDLLLTGAPAGHDEGSLLGAVVATVSITVPVLTLMGDDAAGAVPAELNGRLPIDPATARDLAGHATGWDRVLTHPVTGAVLAVDRYRPSEGLRRHLRERDQRCRFPGCGMRARACDVDHTEDAAFGGETCADNLGSLCRRHHVLKHQSPWQVEHLSGGVFTWTSPTGRVYIDRPPPQNTVTFSDSTPERAAEAITSLAPF